MLIEKAVFCDMLTRAMDPSSRTAAAMVTVTADVQLNREPDVFMLRRTRPLSQLILALIEIV
jgi:hypothetical protein